MRICGVHPGDTWSEFGNMGTHLSPMHRNRHLSTCLRVSCCRGWLPASLCLACPQWTDTGRPWGLRVAVSPLGTGTHVKQGDWIFATFQPASCLSVSPSLSFFMLPLAVLMQVTFWDLGPFTPLSSPVSSLRFRLSEDTNLRASCLENFRA